MVELAWMWLRVNLVGLCQGGLVALGGGLMKGKFMLQGWKNTFALWLVKSEVDDARDQLRTIYAQTLNCACKAATQ